ncbi:MAG: hypothetical protein ABI665_19690 [Vicinamibacterales bacterium]
MDDAKLADDMTLNGIAKQLEAIRADLQGVKSDVAGVKSDLVGVKSDMQSMDTRMSEGFRRVDEGLNAAKIRDEEAHRLLKFGLEAREGLRESIEARFDETDKKHDEEIGLLKGVLRSVTSA